MPNADFTVNSFKQCLSENEFRFNNKSTITAGNGALNYEWDLGNGQISTNISPTEVYANHGTYNVTLLVSSVYGCTNSIIKPIEVYQNPDKPNIAEDRIIPCYGMLGSLRATVTGGVTPYLYSWNYGNATLNNGIDSLPAGVYRLDITDGNGCKSYDTFNLTQPDILEAKVVKLNDALCYGFANAKAKLDSIRGGVAPYYTEWYLGNKLVKVGELLSGVKSDYYKVLMRDFNGCGFLDSIYLSQPNKLEGQISILSPIKCYDSLGSVGITVKGGIKNPNRYLGYDFYWNGSRSPGTNQLLGVQAGLQKVMVYDSNGCALALSIELKEPSKLIGTLDSIIDVRCYGESNGRLHASAKGGLLNYRYLWTDTFNNFIAEGQKLDGLKAGYYKLVVKDRNGCVDSVKQIFEVLQPDPITVDLLERMNITCFNGSNGKMRVGAKGGNGGYEYEWMTVPISTKDSFIENLSSGRYVLKVNDIRGCALETIFTLANPLRNPVLIQNDSVEVCKNDTLYLRANMNQSIAYQWIFNGQNMKYSQDSFLLIPNVQNGSAGIYTVIGTDQLGCQDTAKLEVFMNELPTVNLRLNPVIACLGSDCEMEATGANKYTWYKERYTPVYGRDTLLGNGSIYKFTGVKQTDVGKYFVMGESIQGCKNEDAVYLKVGLDSIVVPNDTQVCAGSTFALRAKGGVSYEWVAPNGKSVNSPSYIVSPVSRSDSGIYTLNVVDRWNCSGKYKVNVMVNPRPKISVFDALLGDHCEGTDVELIANTDAAKMSWMGPNFTQMNTTKNVQSIKNVSIKDQGYYKVVAYSVFGCMDSATTFVKVNPIPLADFAYTHNCPPNPLANEAVNFFTTSLKASKYEFYIDNVLVSKDQGFTHKFTVPGSYVVRMKAMNEYLCYKEITQSIVVEEPVKLNVPNAFTPNNDRLNSEFKPVNVNVPNYKMLIYDRWGSKMYEEMNGAWDGTCLGKPVPIGVYVVIVEYSTICSDDKLILDKRSVSDVTLMR
jgi:gliding motility-associated-like protein